MFCCFSSSINIYLYWTFILIFNTRGSCAIAITGVGHNIRWHYYYYPLLLRLKWICCTVAHRTLIFSWNISSVGCSILACFESSDGCNQTVRDERGGLEYISCWQVQEETLTALCQQHYCFSLGVSAASCAAALDSITQS